MHVITRKRLNEFAEKFPETTSALARWYTAVKKGNFSNIAELRAVFPTADRIGKLTVFNIGGNKAGLIAAMHYNRKRVYIREYATQQRRPYLRFFACKEDYSLEPLDTPLPESVVSGKEPFIILGAIAGG